jgi:hypothetical protein
MAIIQSRRATPFVLDGELVTYGSTREVEDDAAASWLTRGWSLVSGPLPALSTALVPKTRPFGKRGVLAETRAIYKPIERYLKLNKDGFSDLPAPTAPYRYGADLQFPMCANGRLGDCTFAGWYHGAQISAEIAKVSYGYSADAVGQEYLNRNNGQDNGDQLTQIIQWASQPGGLLDFEIVGAATVDIHNTALLRTVLYNFGWLYLAIDLPEYAEQDFAQYKPWRWSPGAEPIGGHCVVANGDAVDLSTDSHTYSGLIDIVTWADNTEMTVDFFDHFGVQAIVVLPKWYVDTQHDAIQHIDLDTWQRDMSEITQ